MAKRIVRLTEADIENIVKKVISEQGKGDLTGGRGRRKNEDFGPPSWKGSEEGIIDFDSISQSSIIATNVGPDKYTLRYLNDLSLVGNPKPSETKIDVVINDFDIKGSGLPYPDNMVKPYFDDYPDAKNQFKSILTQFVKYIEAGGGPKLTNVTIKGSADSATPTLDVPSGYSKLDHPDSKPYGGKTDPYEMNQYLADKRAEEYAKVLKYAIKRVTGFDLNIKVLPGDNYYGQEGKRGEEYKKIVLSPNAEKLTIDSSSKETTSSGKRVQKNAQPYILEYNTGTEIKKINGYKLTDEKGDVFYGITGEDYDNLNPKPPFFKGESNSIFDGKTLTIDGRVIGKFNEGDDLPVRQTTFGFPTIGWVGPITSVFGDREHQYSVDGENKSMIYLTNRYFIFS